MSFQHAASSPFACVSPLMFLTRPCATSMWCSAVPGKGRLLPAIHRRRQATTCGWLQRQAFAGWLWTKQIYLFDVSQWLEGDVVHRPLPKSRRFVRNNQWRHLNSMRILSMPDKWEFPWFAAWDLAFHVLPLALVDPDYAKEQLWVLGPLLARSHPLSRVLPRRERRGIGRLAPDQLDRARGVLIDEWRRPSEA